MLIAICALPAVFDWYDEAKKHRDVAEAKELAATVPSRPESLEGVLVAQLTADEINRGQYIRAMAKVAARDDERHPLAVPPETGAADV
uniref:hypothetical protein n=1 Tax=Paractinoplanes polyasparticus TaxID=2856853 RepID=UPI0027E15F4A|nr:hypothetical protein [Actinoplanes polyasparticus]